MKTIKLISATAMLLMLAACANEDTSKDNGTIGQDKALTTFTSGDEPSSRTSMDRTATGEGKFFWTVDDNIWVNNGGTPESSSSSSITGKTDYAKFYFASTFPDGNYPVTYTGKNSTLSNEVTIAAAQTQSAPNNTDHFATSGDCGTATAKGQTINLHSNSGTRQPISASSLVVKTLRLEPIFILPRLWLRPIMILPARTISQAQGLRLRAVELKPSPSPHKAQAQIPVLG